MNKKLSLYVIALLALLFLAIPTNLVAANSTVAILQEVKGNVTVTVQGGKREFPAYNGMNIRQGDSIKTGAKSSVKIDFGAGNESVLGENGMITLSRLIAPNNPNEFRVLSTHSGSEVSVKQQSGGLWSKVKRVFGAGNSHRVETSTAIMGVRGTLYLTYVDPVTGQEYVCVLDGSVAVETGSGSMVKTALITPGQEAIVLDSTINLATINYKDLIEQTDAVLVAQIILDMIEVATQRVENAKNANVELQNDKTKENAMAAIELAMIAELSTTIAEKLVEGTKASTKSEEVNRLLQQSQQSLVRLETETKALTNQSKNITEQVTNTSKTLGLTDREIQQTTNNVNNNINQVITENTSTTSPSTGGSDGGSTSPVVSPVNYIKYATYQKTGDIYSLNIVFNQNIDTSQVDINKLQLAFSGNVYQLTGNYVSGSIAAKGKYNSYQHDGFTEIIINLTDTDRAGIEGIRGLNRTLNLNLLSGWYLSHSASTSSVKYVDVFKITKNAVGSDYQLSWNYSGANLVYKVYIADSNFDLNNPFRTLTAGEQTTTINQNDIGTNEVFIGVYSGNTLIAWGYIDPFTVN